MKVHGVDERGKVILRRAPKRVEMSSLFAFGVACSGRLGRGLHIYRQDQALGLI
jgi:hypothetical protein